MPQYVRDLGGSLFILLFFSFRYKELKVGREYTVNVFNGFTNAWFDYLILTCISYDYADYLRMIGEREFFGFFVFTIFPEQAENKNKVGIKTTFLFNDENT